MGEAALASSTLAEPVGSYELEYLYLTRDGASLTPPQTWNFAPSASLSRDCNSTSASPIPPWLQANPLSSPTKRCLPSSSLQQEPDSARYLESLSCCAQSPFEPWGGLSMADFLASFNFREEEPGGLATRACACVEELQLRLRDLFNGKVTTTRAERVATRLDLAATAELTLGISEGENHVLEGLSALDPSLGGALSTSISTDVDGGPKARVVLVGDALMNQPPDEPVLQRSIANHVVDGISQVDGSEWTVRESSRGTHGWVFSYICKGSMQHWQRQHKGQPKMLVADYSHKEIDPVSSSRPAFDCRGSITISFCRQSRTISIDYDHIPLHRTVAELVLLYKPLSQRHPLPTPEKQPKAPRQPASSRKKRDADKTASGENNKSRKRKRKTNDDFGVPRDQDAIENDATLPGELQDFVGQTEGEEGSSLVGQQQQAQAGPPSPQNSPAGLLTINVTPEEAERRRNVAKFILAHAGVDPETLSPEQFNIFANQSPDLQKESLNMLVKYGAERLRIVHPGSKEGSAQPPSRASSSVPAIQSITHGGSSGPVTTNELVLQTSTPEDTKKGRRKNQTANSGNEEAGTVANTTEGAKETRRRGTAKSRNACLQCKQRKVRCPKEKPICNECREAGLICEFPAPKPRKARSNALVTAEDDQDVNEQDAPLAAVQDEPPLEGHQQIHEDDAEGYPDIEGDPVHPQIGDVLSNNLGVTDWEPNHNPPNYFPPANIGVSEAGSSQPPHATGLPISDLVNLILPPGRSYYSNMPAADISDQPLTHQGKGSTQSSAYHGSGRNIATRSTQDDDHQSSVNPTPVSEWSGGDSPATQAAAVVAAAVTSMQDQSPHESVYGLPESSGARSSAWRPTSIDNSQQPSAGISQQHHQQQQSVSTASLQRSGATSPITDIPRKNRLTGKRGAVRNSSAADAYHSPTLSDQQQSNTHGPGLQAPAGMASSAAYNSYDRYSSTRGAEAASTDRISYEPYSYQRDAVSTAPYTSYGHGSHPTTSAAPMPAQTVTEISPVDRPGSQTYGPYTNSASRNSPHNHSASYLGPRANTQAPQDFNSSSSESSRNSRQAIHMRPQSAASRQGQNGMKQDRNYLTYPSHMQQQQPTPQERIPPQHTQQTNQQQTWYFNNTNTTFAPTGGHGSNYSWNMPGDS